MTRISRRAALAGGAALIAGRLAFPRPALAQSAPGFLSFKVGAAEVTVLSDGAMAAPLSWVLPDRPQAEIASALQGDPRKPGGDALPLEVNVALVRLGAELILIDAGGGPDFAPQRGKLADNLAKAGVQPEAITRVVFTHAHPDHFWGAVDPLDGGLLFAKARHVMPAVERDYWLKPGMEQSVPEAVRGGAIGTQRRLKELGDKIETYKPGAEIVPGLATVATAGHTPGHTAILLGSGNASLMIGGDALIDPTFSFQRPDWRWGPDWDGDMAIATRKRLLDRLATDKVPLLGYHLPWPGLGRVERSGTAYRFVQG